MHDIVLSDLLAWEPRLACVAAPSPNWRDREVSWAVIARAGAPMLPPLRGGEIVILPQSAFAWSGETLEALLRDLEPHEPAAVVVDHGVRPALDMANPPLPVLAMPGVSLTGELESSLNRLLTERRGELYRAGTEFGRTLTALSSRGADVSRLVAAAATTIGLPIAVLDRADRTLARSGFGAEGTAATDAVAIVRSLTDGCRVVIGPPPSERQALARLVADRIVVALNDALIRNADLRPRGAARAQAIADLLAAGESRGQRGLEADALRIGLPIAADYRVVLARADGSGGERPQWRQTTTAVHDAGQMDGANAVLIECQGRDADVLPDSASEASTGHVAISGVAHGVGAIPEAVRQARFVDQLLAAGAAPGPIARFDRLDDMQAFRLLYELRDSDAARQYARDALGALPKCDRRGELRKTLLAFLAAGGSHVEAARRLGVHRNTLSYRLRQIDRAVGRDSSDPAVRLTLHLALLVDALPAQSAGTGSRPPTAGADRPTGADFVDNR